MVGHRIRLDTGRALINYVDQGDGSPTIFIPVPGRPASIDFLSCRPHFADDHRVG
jgi:hypothetical protein